MSRLISLSLTLCLVMAVSACGEKQKAEVPPAEAVKAEPTAGELLEAAINGEHRSTEDRERDEWRHPAETLSFFGIAPSMTVVEIWPGAGWYTKVLGPYLKEGGGKLYAAGFDPARSERTAESVKTFEKSFVAKPEIYGTIEMSVLEGDGVIAPEGSADVIVTFRNVHNWTSNDLVATYFAKFFEALKPGGVLGVVEHRATEVGDSAAGYVKESDVIAFAEAAGFELEAKSEINANPNDTKDHPFGVWTLPPVRRSSDTRGSESPDFDRSIYDAIGESDRMTLKFRKPAAADGALFE